MCILVLLNVTASKILTNKKSKKLLTYFYDCFQVIYRIAENHIRLFLKENYLWRNIAKIYYFSCIMDIELVNKIKRWTLIALASDDMLVESLVLKGGNAIDLVNRISEKGISRTSYDLDYSIEEGDFNEDEETISKRIEATLIQTFLENEFVVIDYSFKHKPKIIGEKLADFWGGYKVEFKVVSIKLFENHVGNIGKLRNSAISVNPNQSPVFEIEFSKFEYVSEKVEMDVEGYKIYVYTPEMIVFEKVRAICQQLPEYKEFVPSFTPRARARDFYDIHLIMEMHNIDPNSTESKDLIQNIFKAKKVPIEFIKRIRKNRGIHFDNWQSVIDTVSPLEKLNVFDYYFDFVLNKFENITFL